MTEAIGIPLLRQRTIDPRLVAIAVVIPTFMEVLDTTIANVALRYIAGGLSAPVTDSEWVITSYLAANAIILPISGYLATRLGRRKYFLLSIALFTGASALCGMAANLNELIAFRILQGLAGGGLQPSSQGILLDAFPPERQGGAMTVFGIAALLAPVVGPTLGGFITDNYGWEWIFLSECAGWDARSAVMQRAGVGFRIISTPRTPSYAEAASVSIRRAYAY